MYGNVVNGKYLIKSVLAACIEKERQFGRASIIYMKCITLNSTQTCFAVWETA